MWQRDGQGGKTFTTGVRVAPTAAGKRKLVWKREDHQVKSVSLLCAGYRITWPLRLAIKLLVLSFGGSEIFCQTQMYLSMRSPLQPLFDLLPAASAELSYIAFTTSLKL